MDEIVELVTVFVSGVTNTVQDFQKIAKLSSSCLEQFFFQISGVDPV